MLFANKKNKKLSNIYVYIKYDCLYKKTCTVLHARMPKFNILPELAISPAEPCSSGDYD